MLNTQQRQKVLNILTTARENRSLWYIHNEPGDPRESMDYGYKSLRYGTHKFPVIEVRVFGTGTIEVDPDCNIYISSESMGSVKELPEAEELFNSILSEIKQEEKNNKIDSAIQKAEDALKKDSRQ